ncbi:MAG: WG repeat-containing protein [Bacteroidia bacterium]|nr:WG repeat-containing protein [Bacteroidia bacterium]MDW8157487.1 WG repeat-containing protein [Bacteroidia bacterium]
MKEDDGKWLFTIAGWLSGIIFLFFCVVYFLIAYYQNNLYDYVTGTIFLLSTLLSIPITRRLLFKFLFKKELSQFQTIYLILLLFLAAWGTNYLAEKNLEKKDNPQNNAAASTTRSISTSTIAPPKRIIAKSGLYFGILDEKGNWLIPTKFDSIYSIHANYCVALQQKDVYLLSLSQAKEWKIEGIKQILPNLDSPYFPAQDDKGKWGIIDTFGKWKVPAQYQKINSGKLYFPYQEANQKWGILNITTQQKFEIPDKSIEYIGFFVEGLALFRKNQKWGAISEKGEVIIPNIHDSLLSKQSGLIATQKNKLWGFLDEKGRWQIKPQFIKVYSFYDTLAVVLSIKKEWQIINQQGQILSTLPVDSVYSYKYGLVIASQKHGREWGILKAGSTFSWLIRPSTKNKPIILSPYLIAYFQNGFWGVMKVDTLGTAKTIISPRFDFIGE